MHAARHRHGSWLGPLKLEAVIAASAAALRAGLNRNTLRAFLQTSYIAVILHTSELDTHVVLNSPTLRPPYSPCCRRAGSRSWASPPRPRAPPSRAPVHVARYKD